MSALQDPFWLFLHIPKAAGTTLRSIVDAQYGASAVLTYYNQNSRQLLDNLRYMLLDERRCYSALIGHFAFGVHEGLPRPAQYVTMLRHPVARNVAAYFENLKHADRFLKPDGSRMSLGEVLESEGEYFSNYQVKTLAGAPEGEPADEHTLRTAEQNLRTYFAAVGFVERFEESILLISRRLGWRGFLYGLLNFRGDKPAIDAQALDTLRRTNTLDQALYDAELQRFDQAIAAEGELFAEAVAELRSAIAQHTATLQGREGPAMPVETLSCVNAYLASPRPSMLA